MQIEARAKVAAGSAEDDDLRGSSLLDQLELGGERASEIRCEGIATGGPVQRQPMNQPLLSRQQFCGYWGTAMPMAWYPLST